MGANIYKNKKALFVFLVPAFLFMAVFLYYPFFQNIINSFKPVSYTHLFMTGSGGWAYFSATRYIMGIRPQFDALEIDPCVPADWKEFEAERVWRGARFRIKVENPDGVMKGVKQLYLDGVPVTEIPVKEAGSTHEIRVVMG